MDTCAHRESERAVLRVLCEWSDCNDWGLSPHDSHARLPAEACDARGMRPLSLNRSSAHRLHGMPQERHIGHFPLWRVATNVP